VKRLLDRKKQNILLLAYVTPTFLVSVLMVRRYIFLFFSHKNVELVTCTTTIYFFSILSPYTLSIWIQRYKNTEVQRNRDTEIQKYIDINTEIQEYRSTKIPRYKDTEKHRYRDTEIQKYRDIEKQRYRDTEILRYRYR
jgi:hypothetical protein